MAGNRSGPLVLQELQKSKNLICTRSTDIPKVIARGPHSDSIQTMKCDDVRKFLQ